MNTADIKFAEHVVLLDVAFLKGMVRGVREVMARKLGRELPPLDLVEWITCLLLDAGVRGGGNEVQVLLVQAGKQGGELDGCLPAASTNLKDKRSGSCSWATSCSASILPLSIRPVLCNFCGSSTIPNQHCFVFVEAYYTLKSFEVNIFLKFYEVY